MVSTFPIISESSCTFINPFEIFPNAKFVSSCNGEVSFKIILWVFGTAQFSILQILFFYWLSCLVGWPISGDNFIFQNNRDSCTSRSPRQILGCANAICSYVQISTSFRFPCGSPSPTELCQVLHCFCANLLHVPIKQWIISSKWSHNLHLLLRCVLNTRCVR